MAERVVPALAPVQRWTRPPANPTPGPETRTTVAATALEGFALTALILGVAALALRLVRLDRAYGLFIDEATYSDIARSVAAGDGIRLHGEPFTLHPPVGFLAMGAWARLTGDTDLLPLILHLRLLTVACGAVVVVLVAATVWATGAHRRAVAVGALLCLDPFGMAFDGRVMLESLAQTAAVATVLLLVLTVLHGPTAGRRWIVLTGVAGAVTFSTKETFGLVVLGTLALLFLSGLAMPRRRTLATTAVTLAGYAVTNLCVALTAGPSVWWTARTSGLARLLGTSQETGFNAPHVKVSLWDRVGANVVTYGTSYVLLVVGGLCAGGLLLLLWRRADLAGRLVGSFPDGTLAVLAAWGVAACCYLAYAVLFGSIEEQMFYITLAPCTVAAVLVVGGLLRAGNRRRVAVAGLTVLLLGQAAQYAWVRTHPDDAYLQFMAWEETNLPADSRVAVTEDLLQFLVTDQQVGQWNTLADLRSERVDDVVVMPNLAAQGYGQASEEFLEQVRAVGTLTASFTGRASGSLEIYDVSNDTGGSR